MTEGNGEVRKLPKGWVWASIGKITESMQNGIYKPVHFYRDDGMACLRMYNIENGKIVWKNIKRITLSEEEIKQYHLEPGDILINRVNSRHIALARPCSGLNYKYLGYYFISEAGGLRQFQAKQKGATKAGLTLDDIQTVKLPICSLHEQNQIVQKIESRLSICDRLEETITTNLKKAEALRQSILKQAFEGKLVPQDPNDEPAEKLLERIKQEKQKIKYAASRIPDANQLTIEGIEQTG